MYSWNERYLMKDGKPILPVMGEFHFSRYPKEDWKKELLKMKAGGVEIVATYVFWIHHEEGRGEWDFTGVRCLRDFLMCCREVDIKVWLRIGPWAHGECRNGGFPDWLAALEKEGKMELRIDNEEYLKLVDVFYEKIAKQAEGFMHKDGGPVIGIQIENEYGHCGGSSDRTAGMQHMNTLKGIAMEKGLITPYYSATGWGGGYVPEGMLAVLGGYVDAPWAEHTHELEASENFLFQPFHDDANIGSDLGRDDSSFTFDPDKVPYLTAELGGGLQVTAHRRTYPYAEDIEAQTICMLGAGANLIGYYMYHGGINPDGKYTTLQESKATGYNNDLPEKSYDFQTCLRENGTANESYYRLKKHHMLIKAVEELLAPAIPYMPSNISPPQSPEDMTTLRAGFRYNKEADCGFLFINNHQRKRVMTDKRVTAEKPLIFTVTDNNGENKEIVFNNLNIPTDKCLIVPYNLPIGATRLIKTNASYLGHFGGEYYFYTDEAAYFEWESEAPSNVKVISTWEAEHAYEVSDGLVISEGIYMDNTQLIILNCGEEAGVELANVDNNSYELTINYTDIDETVDDILLCLKFGGDKAQLYSDGRLIADWFSNGEVWKVALKRYNYPEKLTLILHPFEEGVYYDLEPLKEMKLYEAALKQIKKL